MPQLSKGFGRWIFKLLLARAPALETIVTAPFELVLARCLDTQLANSTGPDVLLAAGVASSAVGSVVFHSGAFVMLTGAAVAATWSSAAS